ncbi:MAG: hypothetical protein AAB573_01075 [Patescibacteria group bacterium]
MLSTHRRFFLWVLIALLGAILVVMSGALIRAYVGYSAASDFKRAAAREDEQIQARLAAMGASVSSLTTERGVEAEIRARYPVVKPGEVEFVILKSEESKAEEKKTTGFWKGLYDILVK